MSRKHVVRRTSKNNRRKNTDGDRSDSGCFEDVDVLQMANRPGQTSGLPQTKSPPASDEEPNEKANQGIEKDRHRTSNDDVPFETPTHSDECTEDMEIHAILERLSEVTKNPGDLYRLCFSSRLSFCGLTLGGMDEEGSLLPLEETFQVNGTENRSELDSDAVSAGQSDTIVQHAETGVFIGGTVNEVAEHRNCGNREQCVELLSLLSSFVGKAKEGPAVFSQSGLGRSVLGQLSSLLTTLEEAKKNPNFSSSGVPPEHPKNPSLDNPQPRDENAECLMPERRTGSDSEKEPAMLLFGDSPDDASVASHGFHDVAESMSLIGHEYEEAPPPVRNEDDDVVLRVEGRDDAPAGKPGEQSGGVVTSGRRAVTPYSWDYGDIWEKELKRAQSSDSFPPERYGEPGSNMPGDPLMPTFEEIRDELFHDAGFALHERSGRPVGVKRRSRSADGRGSDLFRSEPSWPEGCDDQPAGHSPFVRTVYQHGFYPNSRLTRSGSSLVPGTRSMTINVDKHQGRHVRVFPKSPDATRSGQLDDSLALIVKEAVSGTSTFRGPKPWSMLKRRPSGLRRRSSSPARSEPMCPSEFQRTRLDSHGDSESSDSPNYVSAASSDCLTTDDSSSLTSSHYCAASSVQSSPTVSNRNSACFSDTGSSDVNDFRRVVFQDSSPELYHRDKYPWNNYTRDNNPRDKYPVNSAPSARERFFGNDSVRSRMDQWEGSLDQRFGRISRGSRAFSEPGENRLDIAAKNNLRKSYQRSDNYRGSDPSALRILQQNAVKKWTRDRARSPLVVRSDSDLNSLASVKFVGDSYSRSHISKNLHGARKASRSPSPGSAHTRVLSCEIMQSDKEKRDVYTKVNLSRPDDEEEETTIHDKAAPRLECNGTRQSWHGHLPQRGSPRAPHEEGGTPAPRRVHSERYPNSYSAGLVDRRRQVFRPQKSVQVDQPVRATLVEVKNVRANNIRPYHSTGSFRSSCDSDDSRHWSESRAPVFGRVARYDHSRQLPKNPLMSRGGSFGRAEVPPDQPANSDLRPIRRRIQTFRDQTSPTSSPSDSPEKREMARAVSPRQLFQNARTSIGTPENVRAKELAAPAKTESGSKGGSKEPVAHIVKETSFVGPATFTKYQSPSSPSSAHMHRSKSLNEKDSPSRRRAQESEACRKKALEMHSGPDTSPELPPSESGRGVVRRPERRRRNSEGSSRPSAVGDAFLGCVVDESYCDLRRESIREGTYSTVNAESARNSAKSPDRRIETAPGNDAESKRTPEEVPIPKTKNPVGIPAKENLEGKLQRSNMEQARKDRNEDDLRKHPLKDDVELERATVHLKEIKQMALLSCKVQSIGLNSIDKGDGNCATTRQPHSKDAEVSPVLRAEEVPAKSSHGVNVYIDYRSKRPVSVEYAVAESRAKDFNKASKVVLSKKDKATAKPSTKDKPAEAETQTPCVTRVVNPQPGLVGGVNHSSKDNEENESPRKRLSRKEKHVQEILSNFAQVYEKDKKLNEDFKVLQEPSSPHPYRRDRTIVYTDARSSVDSDTDSISHHSTISSSGSDVTVILNDDTDISADGFKQLAQNNSEIGIELGSLEVGSDDFPDSPDSTPERNNSDAAEWVARLDGSVRRGDYAKPNFADLSRSSKEPSEIADLARATTETGKNRSLTSPVKATGASRSVACSSKEAGENRNFSHPPNETEQGIKTAEPFKQGGKLRGIYLKYEQSVGEVQSTADQKNAESQSNASSPGCVQEIGASSSENTKGKHSSGKNSEGGKGLFSKLKSIRNSFRGKKSEGKSAEKSGRKSSKHSTKKAGKAPEPDIRKNLGSRSLPIFDNNSNEMHDGACEVSQRLADRTQSVDFSTRIASNEELAINHELSRMVNEPTKQKPSGSLRHAVGVKSLSSDQLNSGRVKRPSKKAAKSLEVLLETCI